MGDDQSRRFFGFDGVVLVAPRFSPRRQRLDDLSVPQRIDVSIDARNSLCASFLVIQSEIFRGVLAWFQVRVLAYIKRAVRTLQECVDIAFDFTPGLRIFRFAE